MLFHERLQLSPPEDDDPPMTEISKEVRVEEVQASIDALWGASGDGDPVEFYYWPDSERKCWGHRLECPGLRYLLSLPSCPKEFRVRMHADLLRRRAAVLAETTTTLAIAAAGTGGES